MINLKITHEEALTRTIRRWNKDCWEIFRSAFENNVWDPILTGDVNAPATTEAQLQLLEHFIRHKSYKVKTEDQPWF